MLGKLVRKVNMPKPNTQLQKQKRANTAKTYNSTVLDMHTHTKNYIQHLSFCKGTQQFWRNTSDSGSSALWMSYSLFYALIPWTQTSSAMHLLNKYLIENFSNKEKYLIFENGVNNTVNSMCSARVNHETHTHSHIHTWLQVTMAWSSGS